MINNTKKIAIITAIILTFTMCFSTGFVSAKSLTELQDEIQKKQEEYNKGKEKESDLAKTLTEKEQKVYELSAKIASSEKDLTKLKKELEKAKQKVDKQNEELGGRLNNMYKNGNVGFLDVLLNSGSFSEFLTNIDLVEMIYASDKEVLEELQDAHDQIEKQKKKVEKLQNELKSAKATEQTAMDSIAEEKKAVAADNEKNHALLDELEDEAAAVAAELARQSSNGDISNSDTSKYEGGAFAWPTPGYTNITSNYGWRICPFHGKEFHGAIDIGANYGSNIVAAAAGTVISAGWNGGFGYSVKIDHGGGMVTMYNHCSSLLVSYGSKVSKGQTIAKVGSTGSSTGSHLDYRIFLNGSTVNPLNYY